MRVLHVGKYYPPFAGGMEYFLADLLRSLSACGTQVAALVHQSEWGGGGSRPAPDADIPVYRAPCFGRLLYAPLSPAFPRWLHRAIREFRPDLLHLHLPNTSAFAALMLPSARRLPWVIHWHADVVASTIDRRLALAYGLYRPLEQRLLSASRAIIATSPPYLQASTALEQWRARCHLVPLGLDPWRLPEPGEAARQQAESLWGNSGFRILAIGRLTYYKGHDVLIRAASGVAGSRILIVGSGDLRERLAAQILTQGLAERVQLTGFLPDDTLNALMASCDLICLPSLERTEAFGLVLLEAMRFGKAVVVSDIPGSGTGWVVRQAEHGLLAEPGNVAELTTALCALRDDRTRLQRLGRSGRQALAEQFGIDAVARQINAVYAQSLGGTRQVRQGAG